jgi:ATP-dependent RNA helicase DDX19/DBP5
VDVPAVTLVVNFPRHSRPDDPRCGQPETYLHRIGRTGRFGREGNAINFCATDANKAVLGDIEAHFTKGADRELIRAAPANDLEARMKAILYKGSFG